MIQKKTLMITIAGILAGAIAGYLYYANIGCTSGGCAITSDPLISTIYGGIMGGLLFNMFTDGKAEKSAPKP